MPISEMKLAEILRADPFDKESHGLHRILMNEILEGLAGEELYSLQKIARCIDLVLNNGCERPAESFICRLIDTHYRCGLTPELALKEIEDEGGFRLDFKEAAVTMRRMAAQYPKLLETPAEEEE